jgi:hypothetical protein
MTVHDRVPFAQALTMLAETLNEPMSPARIEGYWRALGDLTLDEFRFAVDRALARSEWFPKPSHLRQFARPKCEPVLNAEAYSAPVTGPPRRPALEAPVTMAEAFDASGLLAMIDEATAAVQERDTAPTMTPEQVEARRLLLREQAKRLLLDEPEGNA